MNFIIDDENFDIWLKKKQVEFNRNGYKEVSMEDLWEYCTAFKWKHEVPSRYYQKVNDILSISLNDYFNFASLKAQVYNVSSLEDMEFDDLLG